MFSPLFPLESHVSLVVSSKRAHSHARTHKHTAKRGTAVPVQSPWALCFQRPRTQNIRVWSKERFIDQEGATWEDRDLGAPPTHLNKVKSPGFFYVKGREVGGALFVTPEASRIPLMMGTQDEAGAVSLKARETSQACTRRSQRDRAFHSSTRPASYS